MSKTLGETTYTWEIIKQECPNCSRACEELLNKQDDIVQAHLNYAAATLTVTFRAGIDEEQAHMNVLNIVRETHQDLALNELQKRALERSSSSRVGGIVAHLVHRSDHIFLALSAVLVLLGFIADGVVSNGAFVLAALVGLCTLLPSAYTALRRGRIDMNVLMSIAVVGALVLGAYEEGAIVIFLNQIGELLEGYSMAKTRNSIKSLMQLAPDVAHVWQGSGWEDRSVASLEIDTRIQIRAGERVPIDARIVAGSSALDESVVTGESVAVDKEVGDTIYGGTLNTHGVLEALTIVREEDSTVKRIVALVQQAQAQKAPYEEFVHRFAAVYTPAVVVSALVVALLPPLVTSLGWAAWGTWSTWAYRALTLLVISCPCALVISTPVSFVSALTRAAQDGVLVKGGAYFEIATRLKAFAFDKTGTLTLGKPHVVDVETCGSEVDKAQVLSVAAALESHSSHPLAHAVCDALDAVSTVKEVSQVQEIAGAGIRGEVDGGCAIVGKPSFVFDELVKDGALSQDQRLVIEQRLAKQYRSGTAVILVAYRKELIGILYLADELRPQAAGAVAQLHADSQLTHIEMLTGDNQSAAEHIALQAGVRTWQAQLMPADKIARVKELQENVGACAFVGDGINDAPALAQADLGITMGAAASDTALDVADVALLREDLAQIPRFIHLAHKTMNVVRENIVLALAVKILFFILAIAGVATMWMAIFADTGIALLVILNGMRLMLRSNTRW